MTNEERQRFSNRLREAHAEIERQQAEIEHLRTTIGYLADNINEPALVAVAEAALVRKP